MTKMLRVRFMSNGVEKESEYTYDYFKKAFADEWQRVREAWEYNWLDNHPVPETGDDEDALLESLNAAYDVAFDADHIMTTWGEYAHTVVDASKSIEIIGVHEV